MNPHSRAPHLLLLLLLPIIMLPQTAQSLRVAVLGSGAAGASIARALADRGLKVTVFEAGRGVGGRTSTRVARDDDARYRFDHGAQYIPEPRTEEFREALEGWKREGWAREWSGKFGDAAAEGGTRIETERKERWVGYPAMNAICRNLLRHENIKVKLQTRADATYEEDGDSPWDLHHGKNKAPLGSFDWLVATDRNSGAHRRKDLSHARVDEFGRGVRGIRSVKSIAAMVAFEKPLGLEMDGITFDPEATNGKFGSLGWAARDTSKPGRERSDGRECWVLQSHPDAAKEVLRGMKNIGDIRERAKDVLVGDFLKSIPSLCDDENVPVPSVVHAVGHRWGAAFPVPSEEYAGMDSQCMPDRQFVACGDYFGALSGRIEGAYLSGISAANELCGAIE